MDTQNQAQDQAPNPAQPTTTPAPTSTAPAMPTAPMQPVRRTNLKIPIIIVSILLAVTVMAMIGAFYYDIHLADGRSGYFPIMTVLVGWIGMPIAGGLFIVDLILIILHFVLKNK